MKFYIAEETFMKVFLVDFSVLIFFYVFIFFSVSQLPRLTVEGCVLTLGEGDTGQLGLGPDVLERTKPGKVGVPDMVQICAGGMHTVCLNNKGEVRFQFLL